MVSDINCVTIPAGQIGRSFDFKILGEHNGGGQSKRRKTEDTPQTRSHGFPPAVVFESSFPFISFT
jgi:hypothetical protein